MVRLDEAEPVSTPVPEIAGRLSDGVVLPSVSVLFPIDNLQPVLIVRVSGTVKFVLGERLGESVSVPFQTVKS